MSDIEGDGMGSLLLLFVVLAVFVFLWYIYPTYLDPMRESASQQVAYEQVKDLPGVHLVGEGILDGSDLGQQRTYYYEYLVVNGSDGTTAVTHVNVLTHKTGDGWRLNPNVTVPMGTDNRR